MPEETRNSQEQPRGAKKSQGVSQGEPEEDRKSQEQSGGVEKSQGELELENFKEKIEHLNPSEVGVRTDKMAAVVDKRSRRLAEQETKAEEKLRQATEKTQQSQQPVTDKKSQKKRDNPILYMPHQNLQLECPRLRQAVPVEVLNLLESSALVRVRRKPIHSSVVEVLLESRPRSEPFCRQQ